MNATRSEILHEKRKEINPLKNMLENLTIPLLFKVAKRARVVVTLRMNKKEIINKISKSKKLNYNIISDVLKKEIETPEAGLYCMDIEKEKITQQEKLNLEADIVRTNFLAKDLDEKIEMYKEKNKLQLKLVSKFRDELEVNLLNSNDDYYSLIEIKDKENDFCSHIPLPVLTDKGILVLNDYPYNDVKEKYIVMDNVIDNKEWENICPHCKREYE